MAYVVLTLKQASKIASFIDKAGQLLVGQAKVESGAPKKTKRAAAPATRKAKAKEAQA